MSKNEVRIIGGLWRGRKLKLGGHAAVRPTLGRVRETLFNWLSTKVVGSDCLDLFAGSGALGFEALSRGAHSVVLVDNGWETAAALRKNAQRLGAENCAIRRQSALRFLRDTARQDTVTPRRPEAALVTGARDRTINRWDIVFLDPPFASNLLAASLEALQSGEVLNAGAMVYYEHERRDEINLEGWTLLKRGAAGDTGFGVVSI